MTAAPPLIPLEPPDPPAIPAAVSLGMELRRRGIQAPAHIQSLTSEYERRGLTGQSGLPPVGDTGTSASFGTPDANQLASQRYEQIGNNYQPPSLEDREKWVHGQMVGWFQAQEAAYMQTPRFDAEYKQQTPALERGLRQFGNIGTLGILANDRQMTAQQRDALYASLAPSANGQREAFQKQWEDEHSPEAEFIRQRDDAGQWLAQNYRQAHPEASDSDVYAYMHRELANQGYQPHFAGTFGATVDREALKTQLEEIQEANAPLVDRLPVGVQQGYAAGTGFVKSFQDSLGTFTGTIGAGGIAEFLERTTGDDYGFRDQQHAIQHYWTRQAQDNGLLGTSEQQGARGAVTRFSELMGGVTGDLAQTLVVSHVAGGAKWAQTSARAQRLLAQVSGMGFMGAKEGGGAYRNIYDSLIQQGFSHEEANERALWAGLGVGLINATLEKAPLDEFLLANPRTMNRLRGAVRGFVTEGTQEMAQEFVNVVAEFQTGASAGKPVVHWDNVERILQAGLAGGLIGGPMGAATGGRGLRSDITADAELEARIAESVDRARRRTAQELQARGGVETRPDQDGSAPPESSETQTSTEGTGVEPPPEVEPTATSTRRDPKIIATPRQMGQWYAKTYEDQPNGAIIETLAAQPGERFRLVDIPIETLTPMLTGTPGEIDTAKVEALTNLSAQEIADLPPIVAITDPGGQGPLQIIDGTHRYHGLQGSGKAATIRGYVPESVAKQIEAGTYQPQTQTAPPVDQGADGGVAVDEDAQAVGPVDGEGAGPVVEPPTTEGADGQTVDPRGAGGNDGGDGTRGPGPDDDVDPGSDLPESGKPTGEVKRRVEAIQQARKLAREISDADPGAQTAEGKITQAQADSSLLQIAYIDLQHAKAGEVDAALALVDSITKEVEARRGDADYFTREVPVEAANLELRRRQEAKTKDEDAAGSENRGQEIIEEAEQIAGQLREQITALMREARSNPLTGGLNRREFDRLLELAAQESDNTGEAFVVVAFDAANLKTVNDTRGDDAGDAYLKATYEAIEQVTRSGEAGLDEDGRRADAFHYGGDEFAILATGLPPDQAAALGEAIRDRAEQNMPREEVVPGVTTFLVGDSAVYLPGSGNVGGLVVEAANAMKARKKKLKAEAGEATDRAGAEEAARRAKEDDPPSEQKTKTTPVSEESETVPDEVDRPVDTDLPETVPGFDDPNGPEPAALADLLQKHIDAGNIDINDAIHDVRIAYPGYFGLAAERPEGSDRDLSKKRADEVVERLIGEFDRNKHGVHDKDDAERLVVIKPTKGKRDTITMFVTQSGGGYWTTGHDFQSPNGGSGSPISMYGAWHATREKAINAALDRARSFAENQTKPHESKSNQASGRRMLAAIEAFTPPAAKEPSDGVQKEQEQPETPPTQEQGPEGTDRQDVPDGQADEATESSLIEVETSDADGTVWLERDAANTAKAKAILEKWEKASKQTARRGPTKPKKASTKPRKPSRSASHASFATRIAKLGRKGNNERSGGVVFGTEKVQVSTGVMVMRVTETGDARYKPTQFKGITEPQGTRDRSFADLIGDYIANRGDVTAELDLVKAIRWARQASIMTSENHRGAVVVVNTDGSIGLASGDPEIGTAEINVKDGYREITAGLDPNQLVAIFETMYAGGLDVVSFHAARTKGSQPFVFTGTGTDRSIDAVLMPVQFQGKPRPKPESKEPQAPADAEQDGSGKTLGSPTGRGFSPEDGSTSPSGDTSTDEDAETLPNAGGYTRDYNPLDEQSGKFKRTRSDTPKAVKASAARARARRDGEKDRASDNIYRIVEDMARRFNLGPAGVGRARMLARWAAGFYRTESESIRLKHGSGIYTFFHEVGHHLHKVMFSRTSGRSNADIRGGDFPKAWWPELRKLGKALYGDRKPSAGYTAEGWAEVVRFLLTDPAHLKAEAPTVYRDVTRALVYEHPHVWAVIKDARLRLKNAIDLAADNPISQLVYRGDSRWDINLTGVWDDMRRRLFDRFQRLVTFKRDLGLENVPAHLDPHISALRANGHISGDTKIAMERGTFDPADPARRKTGKGVVEILRPVRHQIELWEDYMVARRIIEKRAQGYKVAPQDARAPDHLSNPKLREFIAQVERAHPEFKTAAEEFQGFNRWLIQSYAVHYGMVSADAAKQIVEKNLEYITFRHRKTEDAVGGAASRGTKSSSSGFSGQGSGIRRFREGMGEELFPPIESFLSSMQGIISRAQLNHVAQQVTNAYEKGIDGSGRWMDRVDRPMEAMHVKAAQLGDEFRKQIGIGLTEDGQIVLPEYLESLTEEQLGELLDSLIGLEAATFWKPGSFVDRDARQVTVLRDGKPVYYEIKDRRLYDLLEGLHNPTATSVFVKVISLPGRVLRAGATQFNPSFFVPNYMRDLMQSLTMTDTELRKLPEQARLRLEGIKQAFVGGDIHDMFLASGADMAGIFGEYYDPRTNKLKFDRMFEEPKALGAIKGDTPAAVAKDLIKLGAIDRLNRSFELSNRLGEFAVVYEQAKRRGASETEAIAEAGQAAADITLDFQRGGTWSKQINEAVVFFNAAMLGADKLGRFIKKNPVKAAGRLFTFAVLPSLLSMLLNADNEDYWAKPQSMRDRYWYFPTGRDDQGRPTYIKIPKPYGIGAFSIAFERTFGSMFAIDPETGDRGDPRAFDKMGRAILREFRPTLNIAGLQPLVEVMAGSRGYSFYREREIVSAADADLPLGEQGASRSSELARVLGGWMDYPPAKIDYLISGWTGGLGRDVVQVGIDPVIREVDPQASEGEPLEFSDWLVVRRFTAGHTRSGHEAISRFFDDYEELKRINGGLATRSASPEREKDYEDRYAAELEMWPEYSRAQRRMGERFGEIRELYRSRDQHDPDDLDRQVTELYDEIVGIARETHTQRREAAQSQE